MYEPLHNTDQGKVQVVADRESVLLETLYAGLSLVEKVLAVLYGHKYVSIATIYGIYFGSAVLKSASSYVKDTNTKLAAKILVEVGQLVVYLSLLGFNFQDQDSVAITFIVICGVQVILACILVPREGARKLSKKLFVAARPGMFPLYELWDDFDLLYVRAQVRNVKMAFMSMPAIVPFYMALFFSKESPFDSDMFYLLTAIFLWSLEEFNKKLFAEQNFIYDKAGSSYVSVRMINFCKDHLHGPGPFVNEEVSLLLTWRARLDTFNYYLLLLCCVAWYSVYIVVILMYCPTVPKNDHDYPFCMVVLVGAYGFVGLLGLLLFICILACLLACCCGVEIQEEGLNSYAHATEADDDSDSP